MAKTLSVEEGLSIYRRMATIRAGEDRILRGLGAGEFSFTFYPVRGQEAIAATLGEVLRPDDHLSSTYRCFHDIVAKGTPLREITAEQMGKPTGTSKGKGGPMHISDPRQRTDGDHRDRRGPGYRWRWDWRWRPSWTGRTGLRWRPSATERPASGPSTRR